MSMRDSSSTVVVEVVSPGDRLFGSDGIPTRALRCHEQCTSGCFIQ